MQLRRHRVCTFCNARKADRLQCIDLASGEVVDLFNPRRDVWSEQFAWDDEQTQVLPLTAIGRATIEVLALNEPLIVGARAIWRSAGLHPPDLSDHRLAPPKSPRV